MDYRPIDTKTAYVAPAKPTQSIKPNTVPKFDDRTMNKFFFKKWDVEPRPRHGDFHEAHTYVPPVDKFQPTTTTGDTFVSKKADVPQSYKPEQVAVKQEGEQDFNTMYKMTFKQPNPLKNLNKQQAALLLKELRQRKELACGGPQQAPVAAKWSHSGPHIYHLMNTSHAHCSM